MKSFNSILALPNGKTEKCTKVVDCHLLNEHLQTERFKMEDLQLLKEVICKEDQTIQIDLASVYHHIPVSKNLKQYLGFKFKRKSYDYAIMRFAHTHVPLTFQKIIRQTIGYIRSTLQIRCVSYCDDLVFLHLQKEALNLLITQILGILAKFGWQVTAEKSDLIQTQQFVYPGQFLNKITNQICITMIKKAQQLQQISK
ncbi:MAG: hypothetical protein EZS28_008412 [Streblomastix strix]|uniref:Reverse transcriptase domain-containing protein n=1 Tax=Streblomastix strix TaxID=222440 RepID=A0A5J4WMF1_9EUKA|nr:MAG: hypothetical protein EZS28_008412 [Streblomastix strix]